jgi:toxin ParE1/3/4
MSALRVSAAAEDDLVGIWLYIAQDSLSAADAFLSRLRDICHTLAGSPGMGRQRDELAPGVRSFAVGAYLIFYRQIPEGIEVVRVLSGHLDLPRHFDPRDQS